MHVDTRFLEPAGYVSANDTKTVNRREIHGYILRDRNDAAYRAFLESNPAIIPAFTTNLDQLSRHLQERKYFVIHQGLSTVFTKKENVRN